MKAILSGLAAAIMGAALFAGGYALHDAPAHLETRTVTKTAPPKTIIKWKTKTVTQTVTAPATGPSDSQAAQCADQELALMEAQQQFEENNPVTGPDVTQNYSLVPDAADGFTPPSIGACAGVIS